LSPGLRGRAHSDGPPLLSDARVAQLTAAVAVSLAVGFLIPHRGSIPLILVVAAVSVPLVPIFVALANRGLIIPIWLVAGVAAYPFLRYPRTAGVLLTFDRIWIVSGLIFVLMSGARPARVRATRFMFWSAFSLLAVYGLRAATTSHASLSAIGLWVDAIGLPFAVFVIARRLASRESMVITAVWAMMVAGLLVAGLGIAEHFGGFELATLTGGTPRFDLSINAVRVSGPYPVPEVYALVLVLSLAATMMWLQLRHQFVLGSLAVGVIGVGVALSYFRSAWIAAVFVLIGSLGIRRYRYGRMVAVFTVSIAFGYVVFSQLEARSNTFATRVGNTTNIEGRFATYDTAFALFKTAPLFGVGVNEYTDSVNKVFPVTVAGVAAVPFPHSSYLGILAEQGIVGFSALMAVTFGVLGVVRALGRRARTPADALLATTLTVAGLGYLIMSLTLTMLPYGASSSFLMVLVGLAAGRIDALESPAGGDGS
jgi:O-antigen ligase